MNVEPTHRLGLKIAIADCDEKNLAQVGQELTTIVGQSNVLVIPTDVSKLEQVVKLRDKVYETWGEVSCLFCSLAIFPFFAPDGPDGQLLLPCVCYSRVLLYFRIFSSDLVQMALSVVFFSFHFAVSFPSHVISYTTHTLTLISVQSVIMFAHLHAGCCAHEQCWDRQ